MLHAGLVSTPSERAAQAWAFRAQVELDAAARFLRLASDLERVDAKPIVVGLAREAAGDEARHANLCAALAVHFGAPPPRLVKRGAAAFAPAGLGDREAVLTETVIASCVTETIAAASLATLREEATDPLVRSTVHQILHDEISHARLGWAHLAAEAERGSVAFLSALLPRFLELTIDDELFAAGSGDSGLNGLGALDRGTRRALFVETLDEVVFPGLEKFGVDAEAVRQWLQGRRG